MTETLPVPQAHASAVAALLACLVSGCGAPGPARAPLAESAGGATRLVVTAPSGAAPVVEATFADGRGERRVTAGDLRVTAEEPAPHSPWLPVADQGTLQVRVSVAGTGAAREALGDGSLSVPLEPGWRWSIEALVHRPAAGVPAPPCFGCGAEARFPLRASAAAGISAGDSLFLRAVRTPAPGQAPLPPS
ncbi:MAG TPA: hypothetical protein VE871_12275 [Longimicrobium sp.]|nr:hypothetical protein [Longimicrobium sp.]